MSIPRPERDVPRARQSTYHDAPAEEQPRRFEIDPSVNLITELNEAWQQGRLDDIARFYHERAVLLPPDYGAPIVGRDAISDSYRDFADQAQLHAFETLALEHFGFEHTTMVHLRFRVDYTVDNQRYSEEGMEIYTVDHTATPPVIVWRQQHLLTTRSLDADVP